MTTEPISIQAIPRRAGKSVARQLRAQKLIPSVVYGPKTKNLCFAVRELDAIRYSAKNFENSIFVLQSEEQVLNGLSVLKKEVAIHPVHGCPVHLDFYAPDMSQSVRIGIEIKYTGKSQGERDGGVFQALRRDVEVECLPTGIPHAIEVDITDMNLGDVLHTSKLDIPEGVKLITSKEEAIASIVAAREDNSDRAATSGGEEAAASGPEGANAADGVKKK